jgi:hypothetical protein
MTKVRGRKSVLVPAALALVVIGWGCSDGKPSVSSSKTEATVKGTVTIKGKPVTKGTVVFDPSNYQRTNEAARKAEISKDGTYTITTLVGENNIKVTGPDAEKAGAAYDSFSLDVKAGENTFDISLPKGSQAAPPSQ